VTRGRGAGPPRDPRPVGRVVSQVLDELGLADTNAVLRVAERWEAAVGPEVARHCQPVRMRHGVLEARVDSGMWCQQLLLQRTELLAGLRRELGDAAPRDLRLRVG